MSLAVTRERHLYPHAAHRIVYMCQHGHPMCVHYAVEPRAPSVRSSAMTPL